MPRLVVLLLSLTLGAGCAVLVSCGGSDGPAEGAGIPTVDADGMLAELSRARAAFDAGDCVEVEESAAQIQASADNLADTLDPEVKQGLDQGAARLAELAATAPECEAPTTTTTTDKTEPTTTDTEPTTTTTQETTTTTEETTTEDEPPPDEPPGQPPGPPGGGSPGTGGTGDGD